MEILVNTTGMAVGLAVAADKQARDHCVVVVKGTFLVDCEGLMTLAQQQIPPFETDKHYGEPETTSIRYENDFALHKPMTDVLVVGLAVAPSGKHVRQISVRLEVQGRTKDAIVFGDRHWRTDLSPSEPAPFRQMPLVFDRAFGGSDDSRGPLEVAVEHRNLCGVGYHPHRRTSEVTGLPVPNLERPGQCLASPRYRTEPIGFGCVGRAWKQRVAFAGTYDEAWREQHAPFLPMDFDDHYFQSAPQDQWFPRFVGGEVIRCVNMAERQVVTYRIPTLRIPGRFRFRGRTVVQLGRLDTVIVEPHESRAQLVWRMTVPLTKKLTDLAGVELGDRPDGIIGHRNGKPVFTGLGTTVRWLRSLRRSGNR